MLKHLTTHGNSAALVIDKPILELLKLDMNTLLELTTDGRSLIVSPVHDAGREKKFKGALAKVMRSHRKTLSKLAK